MALQTYELVLIGVLVLLLFGGATQIPKLAKAFGRAQGEFKKARKEIDAEVRAGENESMAAQSSARAQEAARTPASEAGAGTAKAEAVADEAAVRRAAREMGIDEAGMSLAEVKAEMDRLLG